MSTTKTEPVTLFNTLSRRDEAFSPITPGEVRLYCCGPTVYNYQHIGNLRTYIFEDVLVRMLRSSGYKVNHVMNITDVGHLVSDGDEGEDKMAVAAKREKKSSAEIADFYTKIFFEHCALLHITKPNIVCKATDHIQQMIELTKKLEERGFAYQAAGNVYFDVSKFPQYGDLAKLNLEELQAGARIEVDASKRNPLDFALWFTNSKFENQELQWDSPWGRGYPGWHIECSAMAMQYLGEMFDIHCGGIDHIPVHHTNEIAQSQCATGHPPVKTWMHGAFLVLGESSEDKMSKSKGNFLTLDTIQERGFDPLSYRMFCFTASYRQSLTWSWQAIESASNTLKKLKQNVMEWRTASPSPASTLSEQASKYKEQFFTAVRDDLAMPRALAAVHGVVADNVLSPAEKLALFEQFDIILGLGIESWTAEAIPAEVRELAEKRETARIARNWKEADEYRAALQAKGYSVEDKKDGFSLKKIL